MSSLDFTLLLSPDNASRKAAEATFDAARQSHPQLVAAQLITTLNTSGDPATQELCAVLARRYLPAMFALTPLVFTEETRESVKTGLLSALSAGYAPSLRRKLCSTVGRLGAELLASNGWPQLNDFMQHACGSGNPMLHESAISVLGHMAPALVDAESWQKCGGGVQAILLDGLAAGRAAEVQTAALSALASMLMKSALNERDAEERLLAATDDKGRKAAKAVRKARKATPNPYPEPEPGPDPDPDPDPNPNPEPEPDPDPSRDLNPKPSPEPKPKASSEQVPRDGVQREPGQRRTDGGDAPRGVGPG